MSTAPNWLSYCLQKPGAWRDEPWENDTVTKVGDKIFAFFGSPPEQDVTGHHAPTIGLKCGDREAADIWLERYPDSAAKMAYIGKHGWNSFRLDGSIPTDEIQELIDTSYELVLAKLPRSKRPTP